MPFLKRMDETGYVDGMFRKLKIAKQAEAIRLKPPPLPNKGPYGVMVVDLPWSHLLCGRDPSRQPPYPTMPVEQMCAMPIGSIAAEDCILWLWTTNMHLLNGEALRVLAAWGFTPKTMLTWAKTNNFGAGYWLRGQTEHCIVATRGHPTVTLTNQSTLLCASVDRLKHSAKPEEFYDLVESLCPAPRYASLFHRGPTRPNWDGHGDELKLKS